MALGWSGMVILAFWPRQRIEAEDGMVVHADEPIAGLKRAVRSIAVAASGEVRAIGRVVGGLADDDRVLAGFEHAGTICLVGKGGLKCSQVEGWCRGRPAAILTCMMVRVLGP